MFVGTILVLVVGQSQADQVSSCPPPLWLPEGALFTSCGYSHRALSTGASIAYDGSKVPDCSALLGQDINRTIFVGHEYGESWGVWQFCTTPPNILSVGILLG